MHVAADFVGIERGEHVLEVNEQGFGFFQERGNVVWNDADKYAELAVNDVDQKDEGRHDDQHDQNQNQHGRPGAADFKPGELVDQRVEQIADDDTGDKRQQHRAQNVDKGAEKGKQRQPEDFV